MSSSSSLSGGVPRSPQSTNSFTNSAFSSDEIPTAIPQRPPRLNRSRAESTSSPTMSGAQYYQHYHSGQQPQQYDQYVAISPRSTPNTYSQAYSSQPTSPSSFILPPSAFTPAREEHIRTGSISYHPANGYAGTHSHPIQIPMVSHQQSSYTTPRMSPGMNGGSAGLAMASMPPLSLPESFLEEQSDYAEYYSDVGFASGPLTMQSHRPIHQPTRDSIIGTAGVRQSHHQSGMFLPSPHLTPTLAPLAGEFSSMSLGKCVLTGNKKKREREVCVTRISPRQRQRPREKRWGEVRVHQNCLSVHICAYTLLYVCLFVCLH